MNPAEDRRKAGVFLLVSVTLLAVLLGVVMGVDLMRKDRTFYVLFNESVSGLEPSSIVKYNGVPVGTVRRIDFYQGVEGEAAPEIGKVQVEVGIREGIPVKTDTVAQLKPQGITGVMFLELYGGTSGAQDLPVGDFIPSESSLSSTIAGIGKNLSELVERLNLFFQKNEADLTAAIKDFRIAAGHIRNTLEKVEKVVISGEAAIQDTRMAIADIRTEVGRIGDSMERVMGELESFLKDEDLRAIPGKTNELLDEAKSTLEDADLRGLIEKAHVVLDDFREIEASLQRAADALADTTEGSKEDVAAALRNIRTATEHVKNATKMLKDDPSRLLRSRPVTEKEIPDSMPDSKERP
ncbi:MAG: MlaD family protein [Planctomycetota bacterium]|jgi:phospholipid/cholesterol/gamma-HCH transport system substrate-binding protein